MALDNAVAAAVALGLLKPAETIDDHSFGLFYDLDAFCNGLASLRAAFPEPQWLHACAIKTNPLAAMLRLARDRGHGAECATSSEVVHALAMGFTPEHIVFDSPCKTEPEIAYCLEHGVHLNVDNLQELKRVEVALAKLSPPSSSIIGLRINPLVGAGEVDSLSVSTRKSKFGVFCPPPEQGGAQGAAERAALLETLAVATFVRCIHVHTGSGGMALAQMVEGCATAVGVAEEANAMRRARAAAAGGATAAAAVPLIDIIDIGGGMPVAWRHADGVGGGIGPSFGDYSAALRARVPSLFEEGGPWRRVVTEFGAALHCVHGWVGSVVEVTKPTGDGGVVAMIHAGSDMFARQCYAPGMRPRGHPVRAYDSTGTLRGASDGSRGANIGEEEKGGEAEVVVHDIAGPLCFAGDVVAPAVSLPVTLRPGDIVVLEEAGGNTLSIFTSHCSRRRPPVWGYSRTGIVAGPPGATKKHTVSATGADDGLVFSSLAAGRSFADTLGVWCCGDFGS